jgi:hypothetical protein
VSIASEAAGCVIETAARQFCRGNIRTIRDSASQAASEVLVTEGYRDDALIIDKIACSPILPRVPRSV